MDLSRVDRVLHTIDPAKLAETGLTITGVTVAVLPVGSKPTGSTTWTALTSYTAPTTAKIRLAGPDADSTAALVVTADADLWALVTDGTQTEAVKIERLTVQGSSGSVPSPLPLPQVLSVNGKTGALSLTFSDVGADASGAATAAQAAAIAAIPSMSTIAADPALRAALVPKWKPTTNYTAGDFVLNPSGQIASANATFTSGSTYSAANWTVVSGGDTSAFQPVIVLPAANGTDDTTALNALLASATGKIVRAIPGQSYKISAPLVLKSGTTLDMTGCTVTLLPGSLCNMLKNAAVDTARSRADATASGTTLTTTGNAFTPADDGAQVSVWNAGRWTVRLNTTMTYVNATTATLNTAVGSNVTNGAMSIGTRDVGISVIGGTWDRGNSGWDQVTVMTSPSLMSFQFKRVDHLSIRDVTMIAAAGGYNIQVGDASHVTIRSIRGNVSNAVLNTDLVNLKGPLLDVLVDTVHGTCGDDFVSLHATTTDVNLNDTQGDLTDVIVRNLFPDDNGQAAFKVHAGGGWKVRSITCSGVRGYSRGGAVHILDYSTPSSLSDTADVLVEDIDCGFDPGQHIARIYANSPTGTLTLRDLVFRKTGASGDVAVRVDSGTTLGRIVVDGLTLVAGNGVHGVYVAGTVNSVDVTRVAIQNTAALVGSVLNVPVGGNVQNARVRGVSARMSSATTNPLVSVAGTLARLIVGDIDLSNGGQVLTTAATATAMQATVESVSLVSNAVKLATIASTVDMLLRGVNAQSITGSALIALTGASAALSVRGSGIINPNAYTGVSRDATQTIRVVNPDIRVDVALLAQNLGDTAYNTNVASATVGVVSYNGTAWVANGSTGGGGGGAVSQRIAGNTSIVTAVNTTTETDLARLTIPGGQPAANDKYVLVAYGDLLNNSGAACTYTFKAYLGATAILATTAISLGTATTRRYWEIRVEVDMASTTAQDYMGRLTGFGSTAGTSWNPVSTTGMFLGTGTAAQDTSTSKDMAFTVTMGTANALSDARCFGAHLQRIAA